MNFIEGNLYRRKTFLIKFLLLFYFRFLISSHVVNHFRTIQIVKFGLLSNSMLYVEFLLICVNCVSIFVFPVSLTFFVPISSFHNKFILFHQVPVLQKKKDAFNNVRSKLNNVFLKSWHQHTELCNPAQRIFYTVQKEYQPEFLSQVSFILSLKDQWSSQQVIPRSPYCIIATQFILSWK